MTGVLDTPHHGDPADSTPHLSVESVDGRYGRTEVVHGVSLDVRRGETLAVLGPSGSGKTTLLRMIAGLHPVAGGSIRLDGREVSGLPAEKRGIGLVPQQGALFPHLSVAANIGFGLVPADPIARLRGRGRRKRRVAEMLELVGLPDRGKDKPSGLSGGQQQRVALARALAPGSELVLLDEPFSALDAELRGRVRDDVTALLRRAGVTAVLVTHDHTEALSMADRVAVLVDGRVVQVDTADRVYRSPATREVAGLTGGVVALTATADGETAHTPIGVVDLATPARGDGVVTWRPEDLTVSPVDDDEPGSCGRCSRLTFAGPTSRVRIALDVGDDADRAEAAGIEIPVNGTTSVREGDRVRVTPSRPGSFFAH